MNFQFCTHILSIDRNKTALQIWGKLAVNQSGLSKFFRAPIYWAHRAVVFAIAQLSCYLPGFDLSMHSTLSLSLRIWCSLIYNVCYIASLM